MAVVEGGLLSKDGWTSEQNKAHKVKYQYYFYPAIKSYELPYFGLCYQEGPITKSELVILLPEKLMALSTNHIKIRVLNPCWDVGIIDQYPFCKKFEYEQNSKVMKQ